MEVPFRLCRTHRFALNVSISDFPKDPLLDFKDFYSIDALRDYRAANDVLRLGQRDDSAEYQARKTAWLDQLHVFEAAIGSFLEFKRDAGELAHIPFIDERKLKWGDQWNRFIDRTPDRWDRTASLCEGMGLTPMSLANCKRKDAAEGPTLDASYAYLVASINDGVGIEPRSAYSTCDRTGTTFFMQMQSGWKPRYGTFDDRHDLVHLTHGVEGLKIQHQVIPVPSGELLINDWFRIPAFTEAVKPVKYTSVNELSGRWATSAHYGQLGFASVYVGDGMPSVMRQGDALMIGAVDFDIDAQDEPAGALGRVCTDLHWATLIDREVLTAIVAKTEGREAAEKQVAALLEEYAHTTITVRLPPGSELHIYHCEHEGLQKSFQCDGVDGKAFEALHLVASPAELVWMPISPAKKSKIKL